MTSELTIALRLPLLVVAFVLGSMGTVAAQSPGRIGLGGQFGEPTGITLKFYTQQGALDFLAAWDFDNYFFLNVHGLRERPIADIRGVNYFLGPGLFLGVRERGRYEDDLALGISGTIGLNVWVDSFEFYGQLTPRLKIIESTDGSIGGGIGVRYYFR